MGRQVHPSSHSMFCRLHDPIFIMEAVTNIIIIVNCLVLFKMATGALKLQEHNLQFNWKDVVG